MTRQWLVVAVAALTACGGSDNDGTKSGLSIAANPATVTVVPGANQTVTVTFTRGSALSGVAADLTVSGAPSGITAAFDDAAPTGDTSTLTITAAANAAQTTATLAVTAIANGTNATTTIALTVGPAPTINVSGTLVDDNLTHISNISVSIWSAGATTSMTTVTADDGNTFFISGVTPPYDVSAAFPQFTTIFLGLSSATPVLASLEGAAQSAFSVKTTAPLGSAGPEDLTSDRPVRVPLAFR